MIIYICTSEILKTRVKPGFSVHYQFESMWVVNSKWILGSGKTGVKCAYLR